MKFIDVKNTIKDLKPKDEISFRRFYNSKLKDLEELRNEEHLIEFSFQVMYLRFNSPILFSLDDYDNLIHDLFYLENYKDNLRIVCYLIMYPEVLYAYSCSA
tara:strand:- start:6906 stop:7211 length:306 start_codon:yes stop_codon:yes gene_type:complete